MVKKYRRATKKTWWSIPYNYRLFILTSLAYIIGGSYLSYEYFYTKENSYYSNDIEMTTEQLVTPFPIGVFPDRKEIIDTVTDSELKNTFASNHTPSRRHDSFLALVWDEINRQSWFQQVASPINRTLIIYSGQRTEEISKSFGDILGWNAVERQQFVDAVTNLPPQVSNGAFVPGRYHFPKHSTHQEVSAEITRRYTESVLDRYTEEISDIVPLGDILIIASMIEREAYDFTDMRIISGVIWNRLFIDMPLQLDATLQFAKANKNSTTWWPVPKPADKFIDSPFNTYKHKGLPPEPIANPSLDAIIAALNPRVTDCFFYFHTNDGSFYCTPTYEEHVALLRQKFGRGR